MLTELVEYNFCKETCSAETQTCSALYKESLGKFSTIIDFPQATQQIIYVASVDVCIFFSRILDEGQNLVSILVLKCV